MTDKNERRIRMTVESNPDHEFTERGQKLVSLKMVPPAPAVPPAPPPPATPSRPAAAEAKSQGE